MGLSGNLQSFGVPEILQLLALQRQSGILRLDHEGRERQVLFIERGAIVGTRDRRTLGDDPFLTFLRGAGFLTDEQINASIAGEPDWDEEGWSEAVIIVPPKKQPISIRIPSHETAPNTGAIGMTFGIMLSAPAITSLTANIIVIAIVTNAKAKL